MKDSKVKKLRLGDINPYVRVIKIHALKKSYKSGLRYNRHYQLHYIFEGECIFYIDGVYYTAQKGDLCLWAPGQAHSINASDDSDVTVAGIQFDFTRNFCNQNYLPIFYSKEDFDEKYINEIIEFSDFAGFLPHIKVKNRIIIEDLLRQAEKHFSREGSYSEEKASSRLKEFFTFLADESVMNFAYDNEKNNNIELIQYVKSNFRNNFTNLEMAHQFGYHPVYLNRMFLKLTGLPIHQYIINLRINEALHLLQTTNHPISIIAQMTGYPNAQYFSRIFKAKTGYPPTYFISSFHQK